MTRQHCQWGANCRNHAPDHRCKYSHPGDLEWKRANCRHGHKCGDWGKDASHDNRYAHPGDVDWTFDPNMKRCKCRYGANCMGWKKKIEHDHQYAHPGDADWIDETQSQRLAEAEDAKRVAEEKAKQEEERRLAEAEVAKQAAEQAQKEKDQRLAEADAAKRAAEDEAQVAKQAAEKAQKEKDQRLAEADAAKRAAEDEAEVAKQVAQKAQKAKQEDEAWQKLGLMCRKVSQGTSSAVVFAYSKITDLYKVHPDVQKLSKAFPEHKLHIFSGVHGESGGSMSNRKERAFLLQDQALERLSNVQVHDYSQLCGGALDRILKDPHNLIVHATCKSGNEAMEMCERGEKLAKKEVTLKPQCQKCSGCGAAVPHTKHNLTFKQCLEQFNDYCDADSDDEDSDDDLLKMLQGLHMIVGEEMPPLRQPVRRPQPPPRPSAFPGRPPQTPSVQSESVLQQRLLLEMMGPGFPGMGRPPASGFPGMGRPPASGFPGMGRPPASGFPGMGRPRPGAGYPGLF